MTDENARILLEKYKDDFYRFAYILTCTDHGAADCLADAFSELSGNEKFTEKTEENRLMLFSAVYAFAPKYAEEPNIERIKQRYGEKDAEFFDFLRSPMKERAYKHLTIYEDLTDAQASEVLKKK